MAKQLKFTFKDKEYVLEFTRRTVTEMEKKGFVAAEVEHWSKNPRNLRET